MKTASTQRNLARACFALALTTMAVTACTTIEPLQTQGDPVQRYEGENFVMRLEFLDEYFLRARYGDRNNPFIAPGGITNERFMVFELDIDAAGAFRFDLTSAELQFSAAIASAQTRFQFDQHWQVLDTDSRLSAIERRRRESAINNEIYPNQTTLFEGDSATGLLVFRGRFPRYGSAVVTIPVRDGSGREIERATFDFDF